MISKDEKMKPLMNAFKFKKNNGFTLLELLLVVAILGIIVTLISAMNIFGIRTYILGDNTREVQYDMRVASGYITKELRNAGDVSLTEPVPNTGYYMIYLENSRLKYKLVSDTGPGTNVTQAYIVAQTDLKFSILNENGSFMVEYSLTATKQAQQYTLPSKVLLNNVTNAAVSEVGVYSNVIYYKMP